MIDFENKIYGKIRAVVKEEYPNIYITSEYDKTPSSFPCVWVEEIENKAYRSTQTEVDMENHVELGYEINVFSNKTRSKKSECKKIIALIDKTMLNMGFSRTMLSSVPNLDDATIYRMTARYNCIMSKNGIIYRRK